MTSSMFSLICTAEKAFLPDQSTLAPVAEPSLLPDARAAC